MIPINLIEMALRIIHTTAPVGTLEEERRLGLEVLLLDLGPGVVVSREAELRLEKFNRQRLGKRSWNGDGTTVGEHETAESWGEDLTAMEDDLGERVGVERSTTSKKGENEGETARVKG